MIRYLFSFSILFSCLNSFAQIEISTDFITKLEQAQLEFLQPTENYYKNIKVIDNSIQSYELALKHRKEKVEIRYTIEPLKENPTDEIPHVIFATKAISIASNDDDSVLSIHTLPTQQMQEEFNADWGSIAYFHPKAAFSEKQHCKMIAVHAEGKGNVYIFYLFNDPEIDLEELYSSIRFLD